MVSQIKFFSKQLRTCIKNELNNMAKISIRTYIPNKDEMAVISLWRPTLGELWPLSLEIFRDVTLDINSYQKGDHFVAVEDGEVVGFIATQVKRERAPDSSGEIMLILVKKSQQRKGIGTLLLSAGLKRLKDRGVSKAQLGGGGNSYFWPGVPEGLPGAIAFFKANGWDFTEDGVDMVLDLEDYRTPDYIYDRIKQQSIYIEAATEDDIQEILNFEKENFAKWYGYYKQAADGGRLDDILLARNPDRKIVGSVILSHDNTIWEEILGKPVGTMGALGVLEEMRGKGIGLALAAKTTELLKERGAGKILLRWTYLSDWYGKLGYKVWRRYKMSWKDL